jgi:D-sedoheptulose 7-phosphate isomerase
MSVRHVIFDRDGVLLREGQAPLATPDALPWEEHALDALRALAQAGVRVSVVTNQSCIGRGQVRADQVHRIHAAMCEQAANHGGCIEAVLVCPHRPEEGCACRKPSPELVRQAIQQSSVLASATVLVGDDLRDLQAGESCGVRVALVRTGKGRSVEPVWREHKGEQACVFDDLAAVVQWVMSGSDEELAHVIARAFGEHATLIEAVRTSLPCALAPVASRAIDCLRSGGKLLVCGNGGSAADAQHFAAEMVVKFSLRRRALAVVSLTTDMSALTAIANDDGFERVFARQVEALARSGDMLIAISTSGQSPNVLEAVSTAHDLGCVTVGLCGCAGGTLAQRVDLPIIVPSSSVPRIQEVHGVCLHALAQAIEEAMATAGQSHA